MEILPILLRLWTLLSLVMISFSASLWDLETQANPSIVYSYNRFSEVEENCESILSWASELIPDDDRGNRIKNELSFLDGDWDQQSGEAPLMPFDDSDLQRNDQGAPSLVKLVSFWLMDVDRVHQSTNTISVSGIMNIGITRYHSFTYKPYEWSPKFKMVPGSSTMTILFEGIYIESKENGGERLMCLMGNATMAIRNQVDSLELMGEYGNQYKYQPLLANDDRIMLVLRYPDVFSLTTRGISGEMVSLGENSNLKYFDEVRKSSQLGEHWKYQFGAEALLKACSPYPYQDNMVDKDIDMFAGVDFCHMLQDFVINHIFDVMRNWESFNADNNGSHLGPFLLGKEIYTGGCFDNFKLVIQHVRCEPGIDQDNVRTSKVFAVFRVLHYCSWKDGYLSKKRTGLSGTTLSAEGIWRSSEGQLCMIGCLGLEGASSDECNTRICFYLPRTFSLKQRSIMFGTISSTNGSHISLLFEKVMCPKDIIREHQFVRNSKWSYKYSNSRQVNTFLRSKKSSILRAILRNLQLHYPSFSRSDLASLSDLSEELSFQVYSAPNLISSARVHETIVEIQILSIGSLFGEYWYQRRRNIEQQIEESSDSEIIEISGQLTITSQYFRNISLSFEGLYDQVSGKMHLVGCRDVRYLPTISKMGTNLEGGMDCQFEVSVEYSPQNARWLMNPMVKISFSSKRSEEDPLHFSQLSLKTNPISYIRKPKDIVF